jgi:hypothetical protein
MKKIIRLTESDLNSIIKKSVNRILKEMAFDKYQNDLMDIELDSNQNINDLGMAAAYSRMNDPMIKNVTGSTMRNMMSDTLGNDISNDDVDYYDIDPKGQEDVTKQWLNTPNASRNFKEFPRRSRLNSGLKNYDSLTNGSQRINSYRNA